MTNYPDKVTHPLTGKEMSVEYDVETLKEILDERDEMIQELVRKVIAYESKEKPVTKYKVIIECVDGKTTMAWLFADGKVVKQKMCRCHYTDKFRLSTGVKIAVERLFQKK